MNDNFWAVLEEIKPEIEAFHEHFLRMENKHFKGTQVFFSPFIPEPRFLFIGINPGAGYFRENKAPVKRFFPMEHFEYLHYNYQLARETRTVFKVAGILNDLKRSMKINYYSFATNDQKELDQLLCSAKAEKVWYKSKIWTDRLIMAINPEIIICEGRHVFLKIVQGEKITAFSDGIYTAHAGGKLVVGYSRYRSLIRNKTALASLLAQLNREKSDIENLVKIESA
ncbi:hypothetical protein [Pedobacter miscanthi]|uniref:hypothetical protein n=1 Tax=Pedobacter miscanthi TaxID=2259170 RepID=UPI00292D0219|nr:hypothetical protein [Pedobacter miscanthi]